MTRKYSVKPGRKRPLFQRLAGWLGGVTGRRGRVARPVRPVVVPGAGRQGRRRLVRAVLVLAVAGLAAAGAGRLGYHYRARSDIFRLTEVTVQGNRMVEQSRLIGLTGLHPGMNLLAFDRRRATGRLEELSWIRRADIKIHWPSRVVITVEEYQPLALVNLSGERGGQLWYLDRHGEIFARVRPGQDLDYPVLTGPLAAMGLEERRLREDSPAAAALRFLRLAARGNAILPIQSVSEVNLDPDRGVIVYLVDRPFPIYLGWERIRTRYYRLVRILERLYRKRKIEQISEIRMDYAENRALVAMIPSGQ